MVRMKRGSRNLLSSAHVWLGPIQKHYGRLGGPDSNVHNLFDLPIKVAIAIAIAKPLLAVSMKEAEAHCIGKAINHFIHRLVYYSRVVLS